MPNKKLLTEKELNLIRGKAMVGHASTEEIMQVFSQLDALEHALDEADEVDALSTEGWRNYLGIGD